MKRPETAQETFLYQHQQYKRKIHFLRIFIFVVFLVLWELAADLSWINDFIFSSPKRLVTCFVQMLMEGIIWQQLLFFFFPILFGTFFQQLYNAADAMIVGRFVGKEALSAVGGSTSMLTQLIVGFFVGLKTAGDGGLCGPHGTDVQYHFRRRDHVCRYRAGTVYAGGHGNARGCTGAFRDLSAHLFCRYHCQPGL